MKVLKNNFGKVDAYETRIVFEPYPRKHVCQNCESELEYEESDMRMGEYGCMFIDCPLCGFDNMLEDNEHNITLTVDNIKFPTHFNYTSSNNAVDVCNNKYVKECIHKAIKFFRNNKEAFSYYTGTGNTMVIVFKFDGDENYEVIVTNNYYNTYIPFEEIDYGENNECFETYHPNEREC